MIPALTLNLIYTTKGRRIIPSLMPNIDMAELGFKNVMINVLMDSDIDGALIKTMGYGLGMLRFF